MIPLLATLVLAQTPLQGQPLLDDLSKRAVRFFWEQTDSRTGLTRDRASNTVGGTENNPNIASIASTGYALSAYAIGAERGWLRRSEALVRAKLTVRSFLDGKVQGHRGWYYHFVDWKTGTREWNCELSSIDSSLLFVGAQLSSAGFKDAEYSKLCDELLRRVDWKFMLTDGGAKPNELHFTMGWTPEKGFIDGRWSMFCELMFLYVLAYGNYPEMPATSWDEWKRPLVEYYGLNLLAGGPLFLHQMAQGYYDFRGYRDNLGYDYHVEGCNATLAQRLYAINNPKGFKGYSSEIWGLSACDNPTGYGAQGCPGWIDDNGTLAPAAAVASVIYTPRLSMESANAYVKQYPKSYGKYGFTTGMNPTKDWYSPDVIGIDLGQMLLNIENARDGLPWKWMMSRADTKRAYKRIGFKYSKPGKQNPLKL